MSENQSAQSASESIKDEFSNKIGRLVKSEAYLDYCEEVYGYRLDLFNMMDREQLDFVMHSIPLSANDILLDLGCGTGSILNLLVEKYGCAGIGIDQLEMDRSRRSSQSITYINEDIDRLMDYRLNPTVTLCIDSLYFSRDLEALLRQLCGIRNNRLYLFYSQYLFENAEENRDTLRGDHTKVAEILNKNGIAYQTIDYSENERMLYERSLAALRKREEAFRAEGNADLYEGKCKEDLLGKSLYDEGRASRFLYIV